MCTLPRQIHSIFSNIEAALAGRSFVPAWDRGAPDEGQPLVVAEALDGDSGTEGGSGLRRCMAQGAAGVPCASPLGCSTSCRQVWQGLAALKKLIIALYRQR